jgi:hypothetical protein
MKRSFVTGLAGLLAGGALLILVLAQPPPRNRTLFIESSTLQAAHTICLQYEIAYGEVPPLTRDFAEALLHNERFLSKFSHPSNIIVPLERVIGSPYDVVILNTDASIIAAYEAEGAPSEEPFIILLPDATRVYGITARRQLLFVPRN